MTHAFAPSHRPPRPCRRVSLSAWRRGMRATRLSWLLLIALLLQQVGIVAYACSRTQPGPIPVAAMAMADMPGCTDMKPPPVPVSCEKHCYPDPQTPGDARVPPVPPSAVPAAGFDFVRVLLPPDARRDAWTHLPVHATDPPPLERFGARLI